MNKRKRILQFGVLPAILIIQDLFIGFIGHYSGTTGNNFTWEAFMVYLSELEMSHLAPILVVAIITVMIVELIIRW